MPNHPKKRLKSDFEQAIAGDAYYSIASIEPAPDEDGKWDVLFYISGAKNDVNAFSPLSPRDVKHLLNCAYAFAKERPEYLGEEQRNLHVVRVESRERAERLASELVYILQDSGVQPMAVEEGKYVPMAPETSRPDLFKPRPPRV